MNSHEGYQLQLDEIIAVMALAGKPKWMGFVGEQAAEYSTERMWEACCRLMRDGLLTQQKGTFRLCKDLVEVLKPLFEARVVWGLTPKDDRYAQLLIYIASSAVSVMPTGYGVHSLTPLKMDELAEVVADHVDLTYPEFGPEDADAAIEIRHALNDSMEVLLQGSIFVLEAFDAENGKRYGWIRAEEEGVYSWLQWCDSSGVYCEPLTEDSLCRAIQALLEGGNRCDIGGC